MSKVWNLIKKSQAKKRERETLMRELERERMLRMDAEQRLHEMAGENDSSKSRLRSLQEEFRKMEDMVRSMIQYKGKLEALKNEKASLSINYENNMQKFRTHVGNLEHENKILMAEIKKIEYQCANCHLCNKDFTCRITKQSHSTQADGEADKTKVLLERLKMLEAEKSALVLENERQGHQYEKCLDEISNRVVQALMSQKTLREECAKLQKRVQDLEAQNKQLSHMFMQRIKFASDSVLQSLATKRLSSTPSSAVTMATSGTDSAASLSSHTQVTFVNGSSPRPAQAVGEGSINDLVHGMGTFSEVSLESLQSICSDYIEQAHQEDTLGQAQLSSPPPWLKDRVFQTGESPTSSIASPATMMDGQGSEGMELARLRALVVGASSSSSSERLEGNNRGFLPDSSWQPGPSGFRQPPVGHMINTSHMFGANSQMPLTSSHMTMTNGHMTSPRVLEPDIIVRNMPKVANAPTVQQKPVTSLAPGIRIETEFPADKASPKVMHHAFNNSDVGQRNIPHVMTPPPLPPPESSRPPSLANKQDDIIRALTALTDKMQGFHHNICNGVAGSSNKTDVSPGQELLRLGDSFPQKYTVHDRDGLPRIQNNLYDDSDSDDSYGASRPISKFSATSTISLSELLDQGIDDMETPNDDNFSIDDFHFGDTDEEKGEGVENQNGGPGFGAMIQAGRIVMGTESTSTTSVAETSKKSSSSQTSPGLEQATCDCDNTRPGANGNLDAIDTDAIQRNDVVLNNQNAIVASKPPLPRPLSRPNSLDLPIPVGKGRQKLESRSCLEYSSSDSCSESEIQVVSEDSDGDLSTPNPPQGHKGRADKKKQKERKRKPNRTPPHKDLKSPNKPDKDNNHSVQKEGKSIRSPTVCGDGGHFLGIGRPKKDHGDYVLLRAPGKLAKLANQDSGVSEPHESSAGSSKSSDIAVDNTRKMQSIEGSPETVPGLVSVRHNVTSSPDSAMQQSFSSSSSTGSDTVLGEKPSFRDDGYSSNSAVSFVDGPANRSNLSDCVQNIHRKTEQIDEDVIMYDNDEAKGPRRDSKEKNIGKLDGFNPDLNTNLEKTSVWTRDGICEEMKESYQRRSSLGNTHGNSATDARIKGLVSDMKSVFEKSVINPKSPVKDKESVQKDRRHSLPSGKEEDGDYVCLDPYWPPLGHVMPEKTLPNVNNNNNPTKEKSNGSCISNSPAKSSRPKMGINAKTIASQRSRSLPRSVISTYPSDPCLSKKSPSPSPKSDEDLPPKYSKLKRTSSDSCLTERSKGQPDFIKDLLPRPILYNSAHTLQNVRVQPPAKVKVNKKEKSRSASLSTLKHNKISSSKDKNQCIVGYVISEPPVPQYEFDVKIPAVDPGYFRSQSDPDKEVRVTGEGSEHGYKSSDEPLYVCAKRPEVVGAVDQPQCYDLMDTSARVSQPAFDVRKYTQQLSTQDQPCTSTNIASWSSDSDGDSQSMDIQLVPLTILSPSHSSPSHQRSPPALSKHSPEVYTSPDQFTPYCDYNLNRKRPMIMSYPPRTSNTDMQHIGSYHTLPAEGTCSKPTGDFKQLMENLAKKSEDVLKSKIFHSETCEAQKNTDSPDYDVILNISFEEDCAQNKPGSGVVQGGRQITDITREIENLTKTVDDLQKSMSSIDTQEEDGSVGSEVMTRSAGGCGFYGNNNPGNGRQIYNDGQKQVESSSSCDDEAEDSSLGGASLGEAFVRKFRRRKKKSKLLSSYK